MALYDIKMNKKITEDFHFDVNEPHMKKLIESIQDDIQEDSETLSDFSRDWLSFPKQVMSEHVMKESVITRMLLLLFRLFLVSVTATAMCSW